MVSKVADGGPASKEDGLKIYDVILKVKYVRFFTTRLLSIKISLARVFRDSFFFITDCMTWRRVDFSIVSNTFAFGAALHY